MRGKSIQVLSIGCAFIFLLSGAASPGGAADFEGGWSQVPERVWVGPDYWANRLQDWRVVGGRLECVESRPGKPMRTVTLLTRRLAEKKADFSMSVQLGLIPSAGTEAPRAAGGFLLGTAPTVDYRAGALVHHSAGEGGGLFAGIDGEGTLFVRDFSQGNTGRNRAKTPPPVLAMEKTTIRPLRGVVFRVTGQASSKGYRLLVSAHEPGSGRQLGRVELDGVAAERLVGGLALVSHPGEKPVGRFWFNDWKIYGSKISRHEERRCGPILSTQYSLDNNILKMTAQMMPLGEKDEQTVELQIKEGWLLPSWKTVSTTQVIAPGWTAPLRVENWNSTKSTPFRVVYQLKLLNGQMKTYDWSGTIRKDPVNKESIVVAAFTGNHNVRHPGVDRGSYTWTSGWLWFPHTDIVERVSGHKPDVLFFSGDNVYEGASPTGADRSGEYSSYLDYMYKWYLWCWAYRDLSRDIPCVTVPDDHDVYQGNLWGAGGRKTDKDNMGGYVMPAGFVKMLERTQTSHLPDPFDPRPVEQGIGVYYTDLTYGRISFAILEDRKFKSGCNGLCPPTTSGRPDHVIDPEFDTRKADVPGAKLLGDRQLTFLRHWAADWQGADMKCALTQTVFAGVATHHGGGLSYLVADYDCNGWPQTGRNKALHELRRGFAFTIGGDQHLSTIIHHGIETWNDAGWAFTVPSIANFYPRAWRPKVAGKNHQEGMPDYTGEYLDGLRNHVTVWAATNPGQKMGHEPAALHNNMPGYGIVRFNKKKRAITMECWPRFADPKKDVPYEGWPKTIEQMDNYGRAAGAYLPTLKIKRLKRPVVQVVDEETQEIVYTLRIKGNTFRPHVFKPGTYMIKISDPDPGAKGVEKIYREVATVTADSDAILEVTFK